MLVGDWWLCNFGSFDMASSEHSQFSIAYMLGLFPDGHVPMRWTISGIPKEEFKAALARGADPDAVAFLRDKKHDARLWCMMELGWVRVSKNNFNLWVFDKATAKIVRNAKDYWRQQYRMTDGEMIDIVEFKNNDEYTISVKKILAGGDPQILKNLAMGKILDRKEAALAPQYSTRYSEMERKRLYGRIGDNPPASLVKQAEKILRNLNERE